MLALIEAIETTIRLFLDFWSLTTFFFCFIVIVKRVLTLRTVFCFSSEYRYQLMLLSYEFVMFEQY